jgi:OOP family OmpA-OmpF porin
MKRVLENVLLVGALCVAGSMAMAQEAPLLGEGQWYVSPLVGGVFADDDRLADEPGLGLSLGLGKNLLPHLNIEVNALGTMLDGYNDTNQWGAGLDFIIVGDLNRPFVPYGVIGGSYLQTNISEGPNAPRGRDDDNPAANWGIGVMARLGDGPAMFRIDGRQRLEFGEPDDLSDLFVNVGFVFPLGTVAAPPVADSDGDGVPDTADRCPGTPPGTPVDAYGCERDSDRDGVVDSRDKCPGTPEGRQVDADGCEIVLDSDGDGVVDSQDACPGTPKGVRVDHRGCEIKEEIELPNVNFELDSAVLTRDSTTTLDGAVATLNRYPELAVECAGHTDSTGTDEYNQKLSEARAHSVCEYLASHGIDRSRLTEQGYGESRPIADNETDAGRAENRRVVLRITGGN